MAFQALHKDWGIVYALLPDLGCGRSWDAVWKQGEGLTCIECGHVMYAKISRNDLRFFAHAPGAPTCTLGGLESVAHHLLKLELVNAARDVGAHSELEVRGTDGAWRADVLASDPLGAWKTALEAQLAPITEADLIARTERMAADGVTSIWFSDRPRPPWLGAVPSVRLERSEGAGGLVVAEGLMKFERGCWTPVAASLAQFLDWAFTGRIVAHSPRTRLHFPMRQLGTVWTARHYIAAEDAHLEEAARRQREQEARAAAFQRERARRREEIRAKNAVIQARALAEAVDAEQAARSQPPGRQWQVARVFRSGVKEVLAKLSDECGVAARVGRSTGDPRYAGGVPIVDAAGVPIAVLGPEPGRVRGEAFLLLSGLLLIFPTSADEARFRKAANIKKRNWPLNGSGTTTIDALEGAMLAGGTADGPGTCTCTKPNLVAKLQDGTYPAEPSAQMGPAAALFRAECRSCGRRYDKPWRRISSRADDRGAPEAADAGNLGAAPASG